ncbi:MAG: hypothetical protein ABL904_16695, partial [Hyphomicrobiaceae bacterium]
FGLAISCFAIIVTSADAKVAAPGLSGGGSVPLAEVLDLAKPYPNLVMQVRLQLVRANLKREQVVCNGSRFGSQWSTLGGARLAPYACVIGKRTVVIDGNQSYFDRNGRKVKADDPDLPRKAAKVKETGLKWQWK